MINKKGFTLIEILIYIAIIVVFLIVITYFALDILYGKIKSQSQMAVQQNARFATEKVTQEIRQALDINLGDSIFGTNPGRLSLAMPQSEENPTIFDIVSKALRIYQPAIGTYNLTSSDVEVTNLVFTNLSPADGAKNIKIDLTIKYKNPENKGEIEASCDIQTTVSTRFQ